MRHTNPNLIVPVLAGIKVGERIASVPGSELFLADAVADMERLSSQLEKQLTGRILPAKHLAFAQGLVGGYRAATEHGSKVSS